MTGRDEGPKNGKPSHQRPQNLALSEYLDDAGVNGPSTAVGDEGQAPPAPPGLGRTLLRTFETVIANPTLVIATVAAIPILLLAWGIARPRKKNGSEKVRPPHAL